MLPTLALALLLPAAPVPKETEKVQIEKLYGKIVDPKGDCKFKLDGDKLLVTLPANRTLNLDRKWDNGPKLTHGVLKGDFMIHLRVTAPFPENAGPGPDVEWAYTGGGLEFRWADDKRWSWIGLGRHYDRRSKKVETAVTSGFPGTGVDRLNWGLGTSDPKVVSDAPLLRLTRRGGTLAVEASDEGKEWTQMASCDPMPTGDVTVSLFAMHSSDKGGMVTFSEFVVTPLKEEKK